MSLTPHQKSLSPIPKVWIIPHDINKHSINVNDMFLDHTHSHSCLRQTRSKIPGREIKIVNSPVVELGGAGPAIRC
jgi:hypothetical protein